MKALYYAFGGVLLLLAASPARAQVALINDTNTAIILWVPTEIALADTGQGQPRIVPGTRPAAVGAERRSIGVGQQGFGTALGPQTNQPAIGPQYNQPAIGQQGSPAELPSMTNEANMRLPSAPPILLPQTNSALTVNTQAINVNTQSMGVLGPQGIVPVITPQGIQPAMTPQGVAPSVLPQGPVQTLKVIPRGALTPQSGTAVGGPQATPGGQTSGSGSSTGR